jgi:succinoglycan biosynthesis transport protein ExoP
VAEHAFAHRNPISPNPRKTLLITLALAGIILVGYPFSVEMVFGRVRSWNDVENYLGSSLLAEIGSVNRIGESDRPHLVEQEQDETATEQFRALYSQLLLTSKIDPPKTILVTSTIPGEGKSFIASNLASVFVSHGRKVLLVDADLRRPSQHRNHKLDNKAGILRWLENGGTLADDLLHDERLGIVELSPGLFLLRTGGSSRKACELMESGRLSELLKALQMKFDIVVLDTPPAGIFPDALAFARISQEVIYICRFNAVSRQQARSVLQRLRQTGMEMPGIVLNAMPTGRGGSYYYYSYGYHAKYYTGYSDKKKA